MNLLYFWGVQVLTIRSCARHGFRDIIMKNCKVLLLSLFAAVCSTLSADNKPFDPILTTKSDYSGVIPEEVLNEGNMYWTGSVFRTEDDYDRHLASISIFDNNLNEVKQITSSTPILMCNFIDEYRSGTRLPVTQDVFSDDGKFEYIVGTRFDEDGGHIVELAIKQDDGEVLANLTLGEREFLPIFYYGDWDGIPIDLINLGDGHWYLGLHIGKEAVNINNDTQYFIRLYSFEHGKISTSLKQVRDIPEKISASPVMPRRNEIVSVDISSVQSPTSLTVVSAAGQVVCSQNLHDGQKNASIDTSRLTSGLYIVRVANSQKKSEICRIIIR